MPVQIGSQIIGGNDFVVIAGPCSIESAPHFEQVSHAVKNSGAVVLRGGIFKLRTHPDSFQGMGFNAFEVVKTIKHKTQMPFISEVTDPRQITDLLDVVDAFQVGSRNMYNYDLLKELGKTSLPVMLKRGFSGLIKEWLLAADYIVRGGNEKVILCERGIRTFETATRNTFDLNAVAYLKQNCQFPVIADPSHATGASSLVTPMALAAAAAGADGIMVEVHPLPSQALSDGFQALNFTEFDQLMEKIKSLLPVLSKKMATSIGEL
ncbi:MAG: 3-deoxy-7-phosphoheptulonate synthase [Bdellovibrionales bacterium]|nr:3-deoxy-7-phosphoheptulonate synthase [Bdellovibrionales bacterium]